MFIDSHAHLEGEKFDADREAVISRAREAGLSAILAIGNGETPEALGCAARLAEQYDFIYATTGIHPHEAQLATDAAYAEMERLSRHDKVIAWGEIGLDYFYEHSPKEIQKRVFLRQMELARAAKLPIVIHCRPSEDSDDAWIDCLALLREHWLSSGLGGIMHCFTSTWENAKASLDMGFLISFAGNITFPKAQPIRDAAVRIPLDQVLIETDCPFLAPVPYRGKRNEPAFVTETARQLGTLHGISPKEVGARTSDNFRRFFSLHEKADSI
jgi:TatD DNase family protein